MFRKAAYLLLILLLGNSEQSLAQPVENGFAVIEMFISEGCGASPTAEKAVNELIAEYQKQKRQVSLLTFHVDYWNKYGWTDPFSSFGFTRRQSNYVSSLELAEVYTPQIFINGSIAFSGSEIKKIKAGIDNQLKTHFKDTLVIKTDSLTHDTLWLTFRTTRADKNINIVVLFVQMDAVSQVLKGDNQGKTLSHKDIVREMNFISAAKKSGTAGIPIKKIKPGNQFFIAAYLQQKQTKKILTVNSNISWP